MRGNSDNCSALGDCQPSVSPVGIVQNGGALSTLVVVDNRYSTSSFLCVQTRKLNISSSGATFIAHIRPWNSNKRIYLIGNLCIINGGDDDFPLDLVEAM